ncbi:MAG: hypothetical protein NZ585_04470 [Chloracidobacterium sp.]|nr:hypothetical protein [Chloracidobacterium sp.]MDW8218607.1 hypothetical protein [Acidobacteriota bacterium]
MEDLARLKAKQQARPAATRVEAERRAQLTVEAQTEAERRAKEALMAQLARLRAQLGLPPEADQHESPLTI